MIGDNDVHTYRCQHKLRLGGSCVFFACGTLRVPSSKQYGGKLWIKLIVLLNLYLIVSWNVFLGLSLCHMKQHGNGTLLGIWVCTCFHCRTKFCRGSGTYEEKVSVMWNSLGIETPFCNLVCTCLHAVWDFTLAVDPIKKDHPDETHAFFLETSFSGTFFLCVWNFLRRILGPKTYTA